MQDGNYRYHQNSIDRLNEKVNKFQKEFKSTSSLVIPPYLKKRNRRLKSLYESMHRRDESEHVKSGKTYGFLEYQKIARRENQVPESDFLQQKQPMIRKIDNNYLLHKKHTKSHHNKKIKKLRFKPEVGIMQKTMRKT